MRSLTLTAAALVMACGGKTIGTDAPPAPTVTAPAPTPTAPRTTIGDGCTSDANCFDGAADGGVGTCFLASYGVTLPGGYCSAHCQTTAECADATRFVCGMTKDDQGPSAPTVCLQRCDPTLDSPCRIGYACQSAIVTDGTTAEICWIPPF